MNQAYSAALENLVLGYVVEWLSSSGTRDNGRRIALDLLRSYENLPGKDRLPLPMILHCPECRARHIDAGDFATRSHHTHACQSCGFVWRPAIEPTVGVQFLPGFKDEPEKVDAAEGITQDEAEDAIRLYEGWGDSPAMGVTTQDIGHMQDAINSILRARRVKKQDITMRGRNSGLGGKALTGISTVESPVGSDSLSVYPFECTNCGEPITYQGLCNDCRKNKS